MSQSIIHVIGLGGGGCNAVNYMYEQGIRNVDFIVANTDYQALNQSPVEAKIQLGKQITQGRGAGNQPTQGKNAALEDIHEIERVLENGTKMLFVTAGMGGGTGTGSAPVVAETAKKLGILVVGIVSLPFRFEGRKRMNQALAGIEELSKSVDSLLVINNEKLREIYGDLTLSEAFVKADNVLAMAARGIAEIITVHGYINVDFADVETVMRNSGMALMGSAKARGPHRAMDAVKEALQSPLLNNNDIRGAQNILMNITSGTDEATMSEIGMINDYVQDCAGQNATIIWGNGQDEELGPDLQVTVIATGFNKEIIPELTRNKDQKPEVFELNRSGAKSTWQEKTGTSRPKINSDSDPYHSGKGITRRSRTKVASEANKETLKNFKTSYLEDDYIDEFETVPAYKRKGVKIEEEKVSKGNNLSRYSLNEEEDGSVVLRKNSWLHDQVD